MDIDNIIVDDSKSKEDTLLQETMLRELINLVVTRSESDTAQPCNMHPSATLLPLITKFCDFINEVKEEDNEEKENKEDKEALYVFDPVDVFNPTELLEPKEIEEIEEIEEIRESKEEDTSIKSKPFNFNDWLHQLWSRVSK